MTCATSAARRRRLSLNPNNTNKESTMGNVSAQAVNLYALLGVPADADGARLRHVIGLHHTAKLLPEAILQKAACKV